MKTRRILIGLALALLLTGCAQTAADVPTSPVPQATQAKANQTEAVEATPSSLPIVQETAAEDVPENTPQAPRAETLVAYFSRTGEQYNVGVIDEGNTAIVAKMIAEATGADTFEILPREDYYPYTYRELTDVAKREQNENARPEIKGEAPDLSQYTTIFIGAPVWWGDWPMILYTFFEEYEGALAGKTLIPFSTHAGSGLSGFDRKLSKTCPNSAVGKGLAIAGTDAQNKRDKVQNEVNDWLKGLGY